MCAAAATGRRRRASAGAAVIALALVGEGCTGASQAATSAAPSTAPRAAGAISARGRIQPKHGVLKIAGPSDFVSVVARLEVESGDYVRAGQTIAVMDTHGVREARVRRLAALIAQREATVSLQEAELANARREFDRFERLVAEGVATAADRDAWSTRLAVAQAGVRQAQAELEATRAEARTAEAERDMAIVRAPVDAQVIWIHARPGERVGESGIAELARNREMYAVAEVYETDVTRVRVGQRARVRSPALSRELTGSVERVGLKIGKLDALGTDPAARTDARVVEVEIRLDDAAAAAALTGLEVDVVIEAGAPP